MTRGKICAYARHLVRKEMRELAKAINDGNLSILNGINMPTAIVSQKYIEDVTDEVRDVTTIQIGLPVQVEVCFYK